MNKHIIRDVERVLSSNEDKVLNTISVYDVAQIIYNEKQELNSKIRNLEDIVNRKLKTVYGAEKDLSIYIKDFSLCKDALLVEVYYLNNVYEIIFSKEKELYLKKTNTNQAVQILYLVGDILENIYDEYMNFYLLASEGMNIKTINSNLTLKISNHKVSLYDKKIFSKSKMSLDYILEYGGFYNFHGPYEIYDLIKDKEEEIFKNVCVKIKECPKMMQEYLLNNKIVGDNVKVKSKVKKDIA